MTEKVITGSALNKYEINKYHYRAFDDDFSDDAFDAHPGIDSAQQPEPKRHQPQPVEPQEQLHHQKNDAISSIHAETLLKKIDELSSSLVKMEMQLERQQADFSARLEEEKKRAYDDGFNAATNEMDSSFRQKMDESERMLASSLKKLDETLSGYSQKLTEIEKELAKTAISIAEQVIKKEVSKNSSKIAYALTKELLSKLKDASSIRIKVNRADLAALAAALPQESKIKLEDDDAIAKGGVVILSDVGNLDGNIAARFLKVKEDLLGEHD